MMSMYVSSNHKDWDAFIPFLLFAYRSTIQESTLESPFFLNFSRDPCLPIDIATRRDYDVYRDASDYRAALVSHLENAVALARDNVQLAQKNINNISTTKLKNDHSKFETKHLYIIIIDNLKFRLVLFELSTLQAVLPSQY